MQAKYEVLIIVVFLLTMGALIAGVLRIIGVL